MKNKYTVIRAENAAFLDPAIWNVFTGNPDINALIRKGKIDAVRDGNNNVTSVDIPTSVLKNAIKQDPDVRVAISEYETVLTDIATPSFVVSGIFSGVKVALPVSGKVYVKAVERGENTTVFREDKNPEHLGHHVKRLARFVPAALVAGGIGSVLYMGVKLAKVGSDVVSKAAERNNRALQSPEGLDSVVREMAGEKPKEQADPSTTHQDKAKIRSANPSSPRDGRH